MQKKIMISAKFLMTDWRQMDRFIAITHGENHVLRNRPLFDWFFLRNEDKNEANLIVAYEEDKLISLLGYVPTRFHWGDEEVDGAWMAHWMTLKEYRSGIGALLMKKIMEMFPIVAGQGASAMNQSIVTRLGFRFTERIPKVVCVFSREKIEGMFGYRVLAESGSRYDGTAVPRQTTLVDEATFRPDWRLYPSLRYGTLRDHRYLQHRYVDYPFFKYCVFVEGDPVSPAVCVVRIVDATSGIKVARILEFFFPENEAGRQRGLLLAGKCLNFFRQANCDYADFYCTAPAYLDLLVKAGFTVEDTGALPSLLDPVDLSRRYQNLEVYTSPQLRAKYPEGEAEFTVTRADGDQDRPNATFRIVRESGK